jgi:hypothetical protein
LSFKQRTVELEVPMELVNRVCRVLAETLYEVRKCPIPSESAEVERLRRTFLDVWVAWNVGRVSSAQAAREMEALEQELRQCWVRLQASRVQAELPVSSQQTA